MQNPEKTKKNSQGFIAQLSIPLFLIAVILFLLLKTCQAPKEPTPQPSPSPLAPRVTPKSPLTRRSSFQASPQPPMNPNRRASFSDQYRFQEIDKKVRSHRAALGVCLLRNPSMDVPKIKLVLHWNGSGEFAKLDLSPDPGAEVRSCIQDLARSWDISPHPGLQPFSYKTFLIPSGF